MIIYNLLEDNEDTSRHPTDTELHPITKDKTVSKINVQATCTRKQGKRLPNNLLTEKIQKTLAYQKYSEALKVGRVGFLHYTAEPSEVKTRSKRKQDWKHCQHY